MSFGKLLKFEFRRLLNLKIVYVMFGVSLLSLFLAWRTACSIGDYSNTKYVLSEFVSAAVNSSFLPLLAALFITVYNCQDTTEDTLKTIRAKGYSSGKIYFAQLAVTYAVVLVYFIFVVGISALLGLAGGFEKGVKTGELFRSLALQLYCVLALTAFYTFFATLVKKTGGAIAVNIVLYAMGAVAFLLLDIIVLKIATDWFGIENKNVTFKFFNYWILQILSDATAFTFSGAEITRIIVGASIYFAACVGGGYALTAKREVK